MDKKYILAAKVGFISNCYNRIVIRFTRKYN